MSEFLINLYVFILSCIVGYHVIWGVTPSLHTPLMAVTNAISGVVIVGAILIAGVDTSAHASLFGITWLDIISFFAVFLASINIFGGFVVTNRILAMFKKREVK